MPFGIPFATNDKLEKIKIVQQGFYVPVYLYHRHLLYNTLPVIWSGTVALIVVFRDTTGSHHGGNAF